MNVPWRAIPGYVLRVRARSHPTTMPKAASTGSPSRSPCVNPKIVPVTVRFGEPLDFSRYDGMQESLPVLRSVTDEIIYRILDLSGQEYVDAYQKTPVAA